MTRFKSWVSKEDMVRAEIQIRKIWAERKKVMILKMVNPPRIYQVDEELAQLYKNEVVKELHKAEMKNAEKLLREFSNKYYHVAFAITQPFIKTGALCFVASPPQITTRKYFNGVIKTGSYIANHFIPTQLKNGKYHKPLIAKFFYGLYWHYALAMGGWKRDLKRFPRLKLFFEQKYKQYGETPRARRLALRDVARILIGNVWLVQMYYLVKEGVIQPEDIVLPYEIAKFPEAGKLYLDPIYTVRMYELPEELRNEIKYITWSWLLRITKGNNN